MPGKGVDMPDETRQMATAFTADASPDSGKIQLKSTDAVYPGYDGSLNHAGR